MSDIDDELLALAGGDMSSDGEEDAVVSRSRERSRSRSRSQSQTSPRPSPGEKEAAPVKGVVAKKPTVKTARRGARNDDGSEEEQGEASPAPASPGSQQSVPMDESDSDSDAPQSRPRGGDDELNKYPVDGMFLSESEKARIMSMREIERETILAERREEIEKIKQGRLLRQIFENQVRDEKKRKASAADLDEDRRKTSRIRTKIGGTKVGETSSGMDTLRRAREERQGRKQQRERENDRRKQRSPSFRSEDDRDGHGESDDDWLGGGKHRSKSPEIREVLPADLRDIERVRVGRSRFAEICFYPGFEEAITGCFVRINVGPDPSTRQDVYRMAVIRGFTKGRPYAMTDLRGHQMVVDRYVKAAHGKAQREWPFITCSDREFTEAEWNRYKQTCMGEGVPIAKKPALSNKIDEIKKLINRKWTELELTEKLNRQNGLYIKYSGLERERLEKQITDAKACGQDEKAAKLQEELDKLEVPRLAFKTSLTPVGKKVERGPTQQDILAKLNVENRRRTTEAVRKAQLKELARTREIEMKVSRGEHVEEDHSRRLKTRAKFVHDKNEYDAMRKQKDKDGTDKDGAKASGASTPASGTPGMKPQVLPHIAKLQEQQRQATKGGIPVIHKPLMDDDIIGALDLDIDIEV